MAKPIQIGITGGIGAGKSLVSKVFSILGVPIYDADSRAKSIMTTDGILIKQIKQEFGDLAYDIEGNLDRGYLSQQIFNDEKKRIKLNELVHPRVAIDTEHWINQHQGVSYILREAALMFESGSHKKLEKCILVTAPEWLRIKRVKLRDPHRSEMEIKKIIASQMPEEEKRKLADFIIENDDTQLVLPQILELHQRFSNQ